MEEFGKIQGRKHMCSVCGLLLPDRHVYQYVIIIRQNNVSYLPYYYIPNWSFT